MSEPTKPEPLTLARLAALDPCADALEWARAQPDLATAWQQCSRGDWMLWLLERSARPEQMNRALRLIAADCAERVLPIYEKRYPNDARPRKAVEAARAFVRGEISGEQLTDARANVYAADAAAWASAAAADAVAYAAYAANAAANVVAYAAYAANAAAYAAYAAYAAANATVLADERRTQADIVRRYIPNLLEIE